MNKANATSLIKGDVIKKVNVRPRGIPAFKKPMNKGMEEQLQKGVIAPNIAEKKYSKPKNLLEFK